jgi:hypothetical protein
MSVFPKQAFSLDRYWQGHLGLALWAWVAVFPFEISAAQEVQQPPLKIVDVMFEEYQGWPTERFEMKAGGEVVMTFRVEGFERLPGVEAGTGLPEDQVKLEYEIELRDPEGVFVVPAEKGQLQTKLALQDKQWTPRIRWSAPIPAFAPSGEYGVRIRVADRIAGQQTERGTSFRVLGERFQSSTQLEVQQVEYGTSENGPWSVQRYFALRDPVYVRYKIAGFQVSEDKRVWVEQDWSVLGEEGEVIVSRGNAATERWQGFYPPRFLATNFSVVLEDPKPGRYVLRLLIRDRIGNQETSVDSTFLLRP